MNNNPTCLFRRRDAVERPSPPDAAALHPLATRARVSIYGQRPARKTTPRCRLAPRKTHNVRVPLRALERPRFSVPQTTQFSLQPRSQRRLNRANTCREVTTSSGPIMISPLPFRKTKHAPRVWLLAAFVGDRTALRSAILNTGKAVYLCEWDDCFGSTSSFSASPTQRVDKVSRARWRRYSVVYSTVGEQLDVGRSSSPRAYRKRKARPLSSCFVC